MTKKATQKAAAKVKDPKALTVARTATETDASAVAHMALRPTVQAALTQTIYNADLGELAISEVVNDLAMLCDLTIMGDMSRAEALLVSQAHTLDAIFNNLAKRAAHNIGHYPETVQIYLRLALKAQSQCARTLETLSGIKNPPIIYAKQANVTTGPQQVNNGTAVNASSAGNFENEPSKLLEAQDAKQLDTGASATSIGTDKAMATVGTVNRAKERSRKTVRSA